MNILHVASEVAPFSKTGGLGDVLGALPRAIARLGEPGTSRPAGPDAELRVAVVTPRYGSIAPGEHGLARRLRSFPVSLGAQRFEVGFFEGRLPGSGPPVPVYFIEHPLFASRPGLYGPPERPEQDYPDNALRFALLSAAALRIADELGFRPDIVHGHDWQAALSVYFAAQREYDSPEERPGTVFTVHNLLYKGLCSLADAASFGVRTEHLIPSDVGVEFYGQAALIKAGLQFAQRVTTVSPRYAEEIRTPEFGYGLEGVMAALGGRLTGILNGADYERWSPWLDPYLPARYGPPAHELTEPRGGDKLARSARSGRGFDAAASAAGPSEDEQWTQSLAGKARCKAELQRELGLPVRPRVPLLATISRLTEQKGIDLIVALLENELGGGERLDFQYVVVGQGDRGLEQRLQALAARHPGRLAVRLGFDEPLSHRTEAGADFFVMPSRFEPCGLNQIYSMRYGTIPIVRTVGGLCDTVVDYEARSRSGTGFTFGAYDAAALGHAVRRAVSAYHGDEASFLALVRRAVRADFSWAQSARAYLGVYRQAQRGGTGAEPEPRPEPRAMPVPGSFAGGRLAMRARAQADAQAQAQAGTETPADPAAASAIAAPADQAPESAQAPPADTSAEAGVPSRSVRGD